MSTAALSVVINADPLGQDAVDQFDDVTKIYLPNRAVLLMLICTNPHKKSCHFVLQALKHLFRFNVRF